MQRSQMQRAHRRNGGAAGGLRQEGAPAGQGQVSCLGCRGGWDVYVLVKIQQLYS